MQPTHFFRYYITILTALLTTSPLAADEVVWQIGIADNNATEFCLGEGNYSAFLENDFGFEDRYYLIGKSVAKRDFAYVLPGPNDTWGGTWGTSGWRTHEDNILFTVEKKPGKGTFTLHLDLVDSDPKGSVVKVTVTGRELNNFSFPAAELLRGGSLDIEMYLGLDGVDHDI